MSDDITLKRLTAFEERLDHFEKRFDEANVRVDALRGEIVDHVRQVEMRLATAIHGVLAAVQDLKSWHQERDDTRARMQRLEERLAEIERKEASRH
jgi:chromosome segregation ATPase